MFGFPYCYSPQGTAAYLLRREYPQQNSPTTDWELVVFNKVVKRKKAYSHSEVIDEAFPARRPFKKVIHFSLNCSLDWYFCTSQISRLETFVHWRDPHRASVNFIPLSRVGGGAQIRVHCVIAIIRSFATSGGSLRSSIIRHFNSLFTTRVRWCRCWG